MNHIVVLELSQKTVKELSVFMFIKKYAFFQKKYVVYARYTFFFCWSGISFSYPKILTFSDLFLKLKNLFITSMILCPSCCWFIFYNNSLFHLLTKFCESGSKTKKSELVKETYDILTNWRKLIDTFHGFFK